ncbi:MAG: hypothetical protein H0X17_01035 [Deltaproteobacteria bacterium]|nr:hypothetical protein [Deltaproteobacteria bacterium]
MRWYLLPLLLAGLLPGLLTGGCAINAAFAADEVVSAKSAPCQGTPDAVTATFHSRRNRVLAAMGSPRHRGVDLIASEGDENQTLGGKLAYTAVDKDLQGEDVEVFACRAGAWRSVGLTRSNDDGRFTLELQGTHRLPVGLTELYAHVRGDGSGVRFVGFVAAAGEGVLVTDIDGTITSSENAIFKTVLLRRDIGHQRGAPQAYAQSGRTVVYVTARGDQYTEVTRRWLRDHGFPPGPLRLARAPITIPGGSTVAFKTEVLRNLGVPVVAGVGNRASDVVAYRNAGLAPHQIFINLPEFTSELRAELGARNATGFDHYADLAALLP